MLRQGKLEVQQALSSAQRWRQHKQQQAQQQQQQAPAQAPPPATAQQQPQPAAQQESDQARTAQVELQASPGLPSQHTGREAAPCAVAVQDKQTSPADTGLWELWQGLLRQQAAVQEAVVEIQRLMRQFEAALCSPGGPALRAQQAVPELAEHGSSVPVEGTGVVELEAGSEEEQANVEFPLSCGGGGSSAATIHAPPPHEPGTSSSSSSSYSGSRRRSNSQVSQGDGGKPPEEAPCHDQQARGHQEAGSVLDGAAFVASKEGGVDGHRSCEGGAVDSCTDGSDNKRATGGWPPEGGQGGLPEGTDGWEAFSSSSTARSHSDHSAPNSHDDSHDESDEEPSWLEAVLQARAKLASNAAAPQHHKRLPPAAGRKVKGHGVEPGGSSGGGGSTAKGVSLSALEDLFKEGATVLRKDATGTVRVACQLCSSERCPAYQPSEMYLGPEAAAALSSEEATASSVNLAALLQGGRICARCGCDAAAHETEQQAAEREARQSRQQEREERLRRQQPQMAAARARTTSAPAARTPAQATLAEPADARQERRLAAQQRRAEAEAAGEPLQTTDTDVLTQQKRGACGACSCAGFQILFR